MIGPVLQCELLLASRRGRQHVFRRILTGWLLAQLLIFYWMYFIEVRFIGPLDRGAASPEATYRFASGLVGKLLWQELFLLFLATPAFAAGAITDEKVRGTLQYLFCADVTPWEIITGKLIGRLAQVLILELAALPLLALLGLFGGLTPLALGLLLVTLVGPLFAVGAASVLASVWARQTRDAVLGVYAIGLVIAGLLWLADAFSWFDPLRVLEPVWGDQLDLPEAVLRLLLLVACWGAVGAACLALAAWRLRPAYLAQLQAAGRPRKPRWWRGGSRALVADDPIRWKERHVEGVAPWASLRAIPRSLGVAAVAGVTLLSSLAILYFHLPPNLTLADICRALLHFDFTRLSIAPGADNLFFYLDLLALLAATLIVALRCSGAVTGEREKLTWEALLLTPLPMQQLIRGKLWGIIGASSPYLLAYALAALPLSICAGGWAFVWATVLFAVTWLSMVFMGAAGLWCSVRSKSSWRSLMGTALIGYGGGFLLYGVGIPLAWVGFMVVMIVLLILDGIYGTRYGPAFIANMGTILIVACLALVITFLFATRLLLRSAQKYVALRERVRYWKGQPIPQRPRRRVRVPGKAEDQD
jgi:ABC-type transport system involved in multi-copper enzyme maturation permease subunit